MTFEPTPEVLEAVARAIHEKLAPFEVFGEDTSNVKFARETAAHVIFAYEAAQWQPIESAPKNGTPILAYEAGQPQCVVMATYRVNGGRKFLIWTSCAYEMADLTNPTHWRPLPPPPPPPLVTLNDVVTQSNKMLDRFK